MDSEAGFFAADDQETEGTSAFSRLLRRVTVVLSVLQIPLGVMTGYYLALALGRLLGDDWLAAARPWFLVGGFLYGLYRCLRGLDLIGRRKRRRERR